MSHINQSAVHCINPDCLRPYPQLWGNKFCNNCGAPLQLLDRYVPLQRLGSGGFAQIYTVWDCKTQTEKVLKVLVESSAKALELFAQEAEVLGSLRHPGVPKVESHGYFHVETFSATSGQNNLKTHQFHCLVMEKINGQTLEEVFNDYPHGCPQELAIDWLAQAVDILQELHSRKIIHRDIKPSNLMLRSPLTFPHKGGTTGIQLVLIDFGGAKQFSSSPFRPQSSTRLYSTGYSPPEQMTGGTVAPSADFYALGRTMIELLTGKSLVELENPATGELLWRNVVNVNPLLASLLDEMIQEDVRSRPANATIIQKRLSKISKPASQQGFLSQIGKFVQLGLEQVNRGLSQVLNSLNKGIAGFAQAVSYTTLFILKGIVAIVVACMDTFWTMILTGVGASFGAIAGFVVASQTNLDEGVTRFLSDRLSELDVSQTVFGTEILLFIGAGLGTAWGLTLAGGFGQRRRFFVASCMGMISYSFGWLVLQFMASEQGEERLTGLILAAFLLTLGLGLRSHHIVYALIAAFGTAVVFTPLVILGFPTDIFFKSPSGQEILLLVTFFGFMGILLSFWLGVSHYLIVPGLRFLGWK